MPNFGDVLVRLTTIVSGVIVLHIILTLLSGCTTVKTVETVRTEYVRTADTLHVADSVFVCHTDTFILGDTVKVISYRYRDRLHTEYRLHLDTIMRSDTIQVPTVREKQLTAWQRIRLRLFWPLVIIVVVIIGGCIIKRKYLSSS